jgi:hypothetical protein
MKTNQQRKIKGEEIVDNMMQRTKNLIDNINVTPIDNVIFERKGYIDPFQRENIRIDDFDTIDKLAVLEYESECCQKREVNEISISQENEPHEFNIDIREYDNFILKIDNLVISDQKMLSQLRDNLLYLECKVPLFKRKDETNGVYYDTFK